MRIVRRSGSNLAATWNTQTGREMLSRQASWRQIPILLSCSRCRPSRRRTRRRSSFAEEGKISFQPEDSDWVFSAAVNYGRSSNFKHVDHKRIKFTTTTYKTGAPQVRLSNLLTTDDFADTQVHHRESHAVVDFSVGKDVGLGLFGRDGSSILSLGVRFAQFASKATFDVRARPDLQIKYCHPTSHLYTLLIPILSYLSRHRPGLAQFPWHRPIAFMERFGAFCGQSAKR